MATLPDKKAPGIGRPCRLCAPPCNAAGPCRSPGNGKTGKRVCARQFQPNAQRLAKDKAGYRQTLSTASATAHRSWVVPVPGERQVWRKHGSEPPNPDPPRPVKPEPKKRSPERARLCTAPQINAREPWRDAGRNCVSSGLIDIKQRVRDNTTPTQLHRCRFGRERNHIRGHSPAQDSRCLWVAFRIPGQT